MKKQSRVSVLWIDDESQDRTIDARNIMSKRKALNIQVFHPTDVKLNALLEDIKKHRDVPDIFLIDYFLDMRADPQTNNKFEARGLMFAGKIRELLPEHPIYGVTNFPSKKDGMFISEAQAADIMFDKLLPFEDVQRNGHDILYLDALDYSRLRNSKRNSIKNVFKALDVPICAQNVLRNILPDDLKNGISSIDGKFPSGNSISLAKWAREILLEKPGILYNEIYCATYLGINNIFFKKISPKLKSATYGGIFSKTCSKPLWWRCKLDQILFASKKASQSSISNPWEIGPLVFRVSKSHIAKCAVCGNLFPETVGVNSKDETEILPVHFKCSQPHPFKKRELYFDEYRIFTP